MTKGEALKATTDAGLASALTAELVAAQNTPPAGIEVAGKLLILLDKQGNGGREVVDLTHHLPVPQRLVQKVALHDAASFVGYVNLFADKARSIIFGRREEADPGFVAMLDYHAAPDRPSHVSHIASVKLETTEEWDDWNEKNNSPMDQVTFAQWLEDRIPQIAEPSAAGLIDMIRNFEMQKAVSFKSSVRATDGQVQLSYIEEINGGQSERTTKVPTEIVIAVFPFEGSTKPERLVARLRWRVQGTSLKVHYVLDRPQDVFFRAFDEVLAGIQTGTAESVRALLLGSV